MIWNVYVLLICAIPILSAIQLSGRNNVCKNFADYLTDISANRNCWYNPDVELNATDIIARHGYKVETYDITTEDGYMIPLYRIPAVRCRRPQGVVYLAHPATATSIGWLDKGNKSLGIMLAAANYDVWIGNSRGTYYSRRHVTLDSNNRNFWNYSFHELGIYDLPAQLSFVLEKTQEKIIYVGFSMGATSALVYASLRPDHAAQHIRTFVHLAPAAFYTEVPLLYKLATPIIKKIITKIEQGKYYYDLLPHRNDLIDKITSHCKRGPKVILCLMIEQLLTEVSQEKQTPADWHPIKFTQNPGGLGIKCLIHYFQILTSPDGIFRYYDYGVKMNKYYYGSIIPPKYPLGIVTVPSLIMYGDRDFITAKKNINSLYYAMPPRTRIYGKKILKDYNHSSFWYAKNVDLDVYAYLIDFFNKL